MNPAFIFVFLAFSPTSVNKFTIIPFLCLFRLQKLYLLMEKFVVAARHFVDVDFFMCRSYKVYVSILEAVFCLDHFLLIIALCNTCRSLE